MSQLNDYDLLSDILSNEDFVKVLEQEILGYIGDEKLSKSVAHPLDTEALKDLRELKESIHDGENLSYSKVEKLNTFWGQQITKAIQCLRFFDSREPFKQAPGKTIVAYGMENLNKYYQNYTEFEGLLYGANAHYRDHVFHVFRVWLIGLNVIIKKNFDVKSLDGLKDDWASIGGLSKCEKISMWTIIAFCHDLGYPLEKSKEILKVTQSMMQEIVTDSKITADFSFVGTQLSINEYIVKFISTKMKNKGETDENKNKLYCGRVQPKYYLKLVKSLEEFKHGVVGAITIYKALLYFLESDFNLNDDYQYSEEDARQFYIRREILRAIASHTCPEIYNIKITTFSSLLYICDELQNWDRKDWHSLYSAQELNKSGVEIDKFNEKTISYIERIQIGSKADIKKFLCDLFLKQYDKYKKKFRDGQDTASREFDIIDTIIVEKNVEGTSKPEAKIVISIRGNSLSDSFSIKYNEHYKAEDKIKDADIASSVFKHEFKNE